MHEAHEEERAGVGFGGRREAAARPGSDRDTSRTRFLTGSYLASDPAVRVGLHSRPSRRIRSARFSDAAS